MVRICTGEVCERRIRPPSTKKVSCMSRAGWSGGVLSASKLFHSVSIHGPVRTSKPRPRKIVSISRRTRVSGCSVPSGAPRAGSVTSTTRARSAARLASSSAASRAPTALSMPDLARLAASPTAGRSAGGSLPSAFMRSETLPFLPR